MNFKDLKTKYQNIDMAKEKEDVIIIKDFLIKEDGSVFLSRCGNSYGNNVYIGISTDILKNKTVQQLDLFIQLILGD